MPPSSSELGTGVAGVSGLLYSAGFVVSLSSWRCMRCGPWQSGSDHMINGSNRTSYIGLEGSRKAVASSMRHRGCPSTETDHLLDISHSKSSSMNILRSSILALALAASMAVTSCSEDTAAPPPPRYAPITVFNGVVDLIGNEISFKIGETTVAANITYGVPTSAPQALVGTST